MTGRPCPVRGQRRVSAETACETVHDPLPRKRCRRGARIITMRVSACPRQLSPFTSSAAANKYTALLTVNWAITGTAERPTARTCRDNRADPLCAGTALSVRSVRGAQNGVFCRVAYLVANARRGSGVRNYSALSREV